MQKILLDLNPVALLLCVNLSSVLLRLVQWQLQHHDTSQLQGLARAQKATEELLEQVGVQMQETAARATASGGPASAKIQGDSAATAVPVPGPRFDQPIQAGPSNVTSPPEQEPNSHQERDKALKSWLFKQSRIWKGEAQALERRPKGVRKGRKALQLMSVLGWLDTSAEAHPVQAVESSPQTVSQSIIGGAAAEMGPSEGIVEVTQANPSKITGPPGPASNVLGPSEDTDCSIRSASRVSASMEQETQDQNEEPAYFGSSETPIPDHRSGTSTGASQPPPSFVPHSSLVSRDSDSAESWCLSLLFRAHDGAIYSSATESPVLEGNRLGPYSGDDLSDTITRILLETQSRALDCEPGFPGSRPTGTLIELDGFPDAPWHFLAFQRPDDWVQLALVPIDRGGSAILLDCVVQVAANSPMLFEVALNQDGHTILRLFVLLGDDTVDCALTECRLDLGTELESRRWTIQRSELPTETGSSSKIRWSLNGNTSGPPIQGTSSAGESFWPLSSTPLDGNWKFLSGPRTIGTESLLFDDGQLDDETLDVYSVYTLDRTHVTQYEYRRLDAGIDAETVPVEDYLSWVFDKEIDWQGHSPGVSGIPYNLITVPNRRVVGVLCRTIDNEICIFLGQPWHHNFRYVERLCTIQPGSQWVYRNNPRVLIYMSPDGVLTYLQLRVDDTGEITAGTPSPLFSDDYFVTTLNDLSRKSPLDYYLQQRPPRSSTASFYEYVSTDSTVPSSSSSGGLRHPSRYSRRTSPSPSPSVDTDPQAEENQTTQGG